MELTLSNSEFVFPSIKLLILAGNSDGRCNFYCVFIGFMFWAFEIFELLHSLCYLKGGVKYCI